MQSTRSGGRPPQCELGACYDVGAGRTMIIDTHVHITWGMHGHTGRGPTKSLTYGRVQQGDEEIQMMPPFNPGPTAIEPEALVRFMDATGVDKVLKYLT